MRAQASLAPKSFLPVRLVIDKKKMTVVGVERLSVATVKIGK
jgi:hypothetical protein